MKHRPYLSQTHTLLDSTDWSCTSLGDRSTWPSSLRGYVAMVMAMPTPAIIFWGPQLTQIYNDGYAQIMGPRHPRFFGAPYRDCWPDTYPLIYPWMRRVLDDGEVVEVDRERIPVTRFGFEEDAWFTFTFTPLRDDQGRIQGILQPVFEVTDSVLAQRRARALRGLSGLVGGPGLWVRAIAALHAASEDIPQASIWRAGDDGAPACVGASVDGEPGTAEQPAVRAAVADVLRTGRCAWVDTPRALVLPVSAGSLPPPRAVLVAHTNPRLREVDAYVDFLEMVAVELSAALQRADALHEEERQRAFLGRLFEQAPAGIAVLRGPRHVFEMANPLYRALVGDRDVIGLTVREALPELEGQPFFDILDRVYRTHEPYVGLAVEAVLVRTPGGAPEPVFFNFVYQPLLGEHPLPDGILVFCYEVTVQVLARQQSDRLAEALRQEHLRKDEFLAMLAHELRNPLAPVSSAAELLMRAPGREDVVRRSSAIIARQVRHMAGLVDELLEVSRVTRGLVDLDRELEDLQAVLREAVEQAHPLIEARSHQLVLDLPGAGTARVMGDHKRLVQVFANLLNNAAKYTPPQGTITVSLVERGATLEVRVHDTGIGIEEELLPRVFELFVQGRRTAASEGGLGIGLALVRSLVQMHNGEVTACSAGAGAGSCFTVTLPAA